MSTASPSVAWWFPGQGTQKVGMGKELAASSDAARRIFERADEALGMALTQLIFAGPASDLTLTENAQPAILTTSFACLEALRAAYPDLPAPAFAAGHSLGEYTALAAAGALSFEDAVQLVRARGQAMQRAVPAGHGGMAAILGGSIDDVRELCREAAAPGEPLTPANYNAPGQIAIAGSRAALQRVMELASSRRMKAIPLEVSAPFHSQLMTKAADELKPELDRVSIAPLAFPVVSNLEAQPNQDARRVASLLLKQVTEPVLWQQSVEWMVSQGVNKALEIGPGRVLGGLARRIAPNLEVQHINDRASLEAVGPFLGLS